MMKNKIDVYQSKLIFITMTTIFKHFRQREWNFHRRRN